MIAVRICPNAQRNRRVKSLARARGEDNAAWLGRALAKEPLSGVAILLVGGARLIDFKLRVAQGNARIDMLPSFWSDAAVVLPAKGEPGFTILSASAQSPTDPHTVPRRNAITEIPLTALADPRSTPNLALLHFAGPTADRARDAVNLLQHGRLVVDLVTPLVEWLAYSWGAAGKDNPLLRGIPIPSALFADSVMAQMEIDILPGLEERASCPEAIWQAALWWSEYYDDPMSGGAAPRGVYVLGQEAAAITAE